ncbi:MAG: hypothetical protein DMG41_31015 [Acidobacteria bacterium]|nr:MAG: hypothetical protein AUH13_00895 [Acidobacteria bacterium 13_2_20CM_58_27]PYT67239.1 MAG: hypothetical protein DMG42_27380 [Acidobacteriota bacterium]PYT83516.1 MAG: hypothetical protein DMG41_31015 [Acidobacteriota bacterium]
MKSSVPCGNFYMDSRFRVDDKKGNLAAPLFAKLAYRFESAPTKCAFFQTTRTAKVVRSVLVQL